MLNAGNAKIILVIICSFDVNTYLHFLRQYVLALLTVIYE